MKKLLLSIISFLMILPVMATNLDELPGSYTGTLSVKLISDDENGVSMDPPNGELPVIPIYIEKEAGKNTMIFSLHNFSFMGIPVGDIIVSDVVVDTNGNIVAPAIIIDKRGDEENALGYLPTQLSGNITNGKALLKIKVDWNSSGKDENNNWIHPSEWAEGDATPVFVTFDGTKDITDGINNKFENTIKTTYAENKLSLTGAEIVGYRIYNMNGRVVGYNNNYAHIIDLNQYPFGIYLVEIKTTHGTVTRKVYRK